MKKSITSPPQLSPGKQPRHHFLIFVPEGKRDAKTVPIELNNKWVTRILRRYAEQFGGATAYGRGIGAWQSKNKIHWDRVTVVEMWVNPDAKGLKRKLKSFWALIIEMRDDLNEDVIGIIINGRWTEV